MRAKLTAMRNETFIDLLRSVTKKRPAEKTPGADCSGFSGAGVRLQMSDLRRTFPIFFGIHGLVRAEKAPLNK